MEIGSVKYCQLTGNETIPPAGAAGTHFTYSDEVPALPMEGRQELRRSAEDSPIDPTWKITVPFTLEQLQQLRREAEELAPRLVLVYVAGGSPRYNKLLRFLKANLRDNDFFMQARLNGYFLLRFAEAAEALNCILSSHLVWGGRMVWFAKWDSHSDAANVARRFGYLIRIQFPDLEPLHREEQWLRRLGGLIGVVISVETKRMALRRPAGPIILVRVSKIDELPATLLIPSFVGEDPKRALQEQRVLYSGLYNRCEKFDQSALDCIRSQSEATVGQPSNPTKRESFHPFGNPPSAVMPAGTVECRLERQEATDPSIEHSAVSPLQPVLDISTLAVSQDLLEVNTVPPELQLPKETSRDHSPRQNQVQGSQLLPPALPAAIIPTSSSELDAADVLGSEGKEISTSSSQGNCTSASSGSTPSVLHDEGSREEGPQADLVKFSNSPISTPKRSTATALELPSQLQTPSAAPGLSPTTILPTSSYPRWGAVLEHQFSGSILKPTVFPVFQSNPFKASLGEDSSQIRHFRRQPRKSSEDSLQCKSPGLRQDTDSTSNPILNAIQELRLGSDEPSKSRPNKLENAAIAGSLATTKN